MLYCLLGILIIIFILMTLIGKRSATCEGFVYENETIGKSVNKDDMQRLYGESESGSDLLVQSNQQMNNINSQINNNLNLQNERPQKNPRMTQESRQQSKQELEQATNRIRFQMPVRLEMELPYEQSTDENKKYSNDMIQIQAENNKNIGTQLENIIKKGNANIKIKNIIKKAAELSLLALDNSKEPISSLKSSNYAIAYVSTLQEIYTDDQIQNATNINVNQFKNELLKIQTTITANIKNTCSSLETDKQYLLKIINNI